MNRYKQNLLLFSVLFVALLSNSVLFIECTKANCNPDPGYPTDDQTNTCINTTCNSECYIPSESSHAQCLTFVGITDWDCGNALGPGENRGNYDVVVAEENKHACCCKHQERNVICANRCNGFYFGACPYGHLSDGIGCFEPIKPDHFTGCCCPACGNAEDFTNNEKYNYCCVNCPTCMDGDPMFRPLYLNHTKCCTQNPNLLGCGDVNGTCDIGLDALLINNTEECEPNFNVANALCTKDNCQDNCICLPGTKNIAVGVPTSSPSPSPTSSPSPPSSGSPSPPSSGSPFTPPLGFPLLSP